MSPVPLHGLLIAYATLAAAIGILCVAVYLGMEARPKVTVAGVGLRRAPGCTGDVLPWSGLPEAVAAARTVLTRTLGPAEAARFLARLWIDVVPVGEPVRGPFVGGGGPGKTLAGCGVGGTIDGVRPFVIGPLYRIARIAQELDPTTGELVPPAGVLFHEIAKHLVPLDHGHGLNADHTDKDAAELERAMLVELRAIQGRAPTRPTRPPPAEA